MDEDNLDNEDFMFDDDDDDSFERERKRRKNLPVYKKAMEILKTVESLVESLSETDKKMYASHLSESSLIMCAKIAGAVGSDSWLICMQNAAIVRHHAEYLLTATSGMRHMTAADKNYIMVLRTEIEEFRMLFKEWVSGFKEMDADGFDDEWGLFLR